MNDERAPRRERILVSAGEGFTAGELAERLTSSGFDVARATTGGDAMRELASGRIDLVLTEWRLADLEEGALVRRARRRTPHPPVIVFGGHLPPGRVRDILRAGAEDYLELPAELPQAAARARAALERAWAGAAGEEGLAGRGGASSLLLGSSEAIRQVNATIAQIAPFKVSVLVTGESGTGKELVARSIHERSPRRAAPFVAVNCGALPPGVLESELFGHERGAFTGAVGERKGRFELADGGTLFLDEVGELPPATQVELLRVLEEETFLRVGGTREVKVDVRIVAATNRDLEGAVRDGGFRQDLYHRLRVVSVKLPPLRERPEDIPLLVDHFVRSSARRHAVEPPLLSREAMERLMRLPWPGNVRELRNLVDSLVILAAGREVTPADLPPDPAADGAGSSPNLPVRVGMAREDAEKEIIYQSLLALRAEISEIKHLILRQSAITGGAGRDAATAGDGEPPSRGAVMPPPSMAETEEGAIRGALAYTGGNRREAARLLGIGLRTLYRKLRLYGIT